jgi:hypothetical protein
MIIFLLALISLYSEDIDHSKHECIVINATSEVDLGDIPQEGPSQEYNNDAIIKFEINCCTNRNIRVNILTDIQVNNLSIDHEWKAGSDTGFESALTDGDIFRVTNNKFFVTVKIKSISADAQSAQGEIEFTPTIKVEYCD